MGSLNVLGFGVQGFGIWGFPKVRGAFLGPHNKHYGRLGSILGPPYLGNHPILRSVVH